MPFFKWLLAEMRRFLRRRAPLYPPVSYSPIPSIMTSVSSPPPPLIPLAYDTRFGAATDTSTGWITFGLNGASKRIWVDSVNGSDANNGLTAATAKATWAAATALWLGAGFTSGDQLMVAGGASQTYTDTGATAWDGKGGISLAYPTAVLSYDSTDPTNAAKYGKLTGAKMPSVQIHATGSSQTLTCFSANSANYFAVQGIEFDGQGGGFGLNPIGFIHQHNGLAFQNNRFKECGVGIDSSTDPRCTTIHFSKNSFWGNWCGDTTYGGAVGNCQAIYLGNVDGAYVQDNIFAHCGWKIGASRGDAASAGGSTAFSHGHYYHASGINGVFDRNVYTDTAFDGFNLRGGATASVIVTLDEPTSLTLGSFTSSYTEAPAGVLQQVDDVLVMGGATDVNIAGSGNCIRTSNTILGSHLINVAVFDNPVMSGANSLVLPYRADPSMLIDQYLLMQNVHAYNAAGGLETSGSNAQIHDTWTNCLVDSLSFTLPSTTLNNTIVHSGLTSYPLAQTRDQIVTTMLTGMGLTPGANYTTRKGQLINAMLWRPDLNWAQALLTIGLPTLGLTLTKTPSTAIPNVSAETPRAVYSVSSWTPAALGAKLAMWLEGDTLAGTNGSSIASWTDASGNGNHATQGTGANQPTLVTSGLNGKNTVAFAGASSQYFTAPLAMVSSLTQGAAVSVYKNSVTPTVDPRAGPVLGDWTASLTGTHEPYADNNFYEDFFSSTRRTITTVPTSAAFRILGLRSKAAAFWMNMNGTNYLTDGTNTVSVPSSSAPLIGRTAAGGNYLDGQIAEIVFTNDFLTDAEFQKVEGYLAWKWGLQGNLPAGHPYKSAAP